MHNHIGHMLLVLSLVAPYRLVLCTVEERNGTWEAYDVTFTRRILGTNSTTSASGGYTARATGTLALYCLFGLFVLASVSTCVLGIIVTLQWPNPRICCYRTPYADIPTSESLGCCALHRVNIGFSVTWLALLVLLVLALVVYLIAAAAVLALIHAVIAYRLIKQLKMAPQSSPPNQIALAIDIRHVMGGLVTGVAVDCPLPGVPVPGIPVINVPMTVALVEAPLQTHINFNNDNGGGGAGNNRAGDGSNGCHAGSSRRVGRVDDSGCAWRMAGVGMSDEEAATSAAEQQDFGRQSGPPVEADTHPETSSRVAANWRPAPVLTPPAAVTAHSDAPIGDVSMAVNSSQDQPTHLPCNITSYRDGAGQLQAHSEQLQEGHEKAGVAVQRGGSTSPCAGPGATSRPRSGGGEAAIAPGISGGTPPA
ncbi:hypothetical protein VaNZ11_013372 [Volvox africanus]|uniref:Uncharacterized protein n=1 Tax=Volvox africanus TaxID=51714 RepID=A0ABQ5SG45_9CHLO|nr:hypothetical protein VaNZ11_013372 [Volvox africanus]